MRNMRHSQSLLSTICDLQTLRTFLFLSILTLSATGEARVGLVFPNGSVLEFAKPALAIESVEVEAADETNDKTNEKTDLLLRRCLNYHLDWASGLCNFNVDYSTDMKIPYDTLLRAILSAASSLDREKKLPPSWSTKVRHYDENASIDRTVLTEEITAIEKKITNSESAIKRIQDFLTKYNKVEASVLDQHNRKIREMQESIRVAQEDISSRKDFIEIVAKVEGLIELMESPTSELVVDFLEIEGDAEDAEDETDHRAFYSIFNLLMKGRYLVTNSMKVPLEKSLYVEENYGNELGFTIELKASENTQCVWLIVDKFSTERGYDFLEVLDDANSQLAAFSGEIKQGTELGPFPANSLKLKFTSDGSTSRGGVSITQYLQSTESCEKIEESMSFYRDILAN